MNYHIRNRAASRLTTARVQQRLKRMIMLTVRCTSTDETVRLVP